MNVVIPGILEQTWPEIERKLELIKPFAKTVHIDIIDGVFANNKTFLDPQPFKKYSNDFFFELHMMVAEPINYLKPWGEAGFKRFLGHIEKMSNQEEFIQTAKQFGDASLAIDGPTRIEEIKVKLENLDAVLIYTSDRVGFSGPKLNPQRLEKIKELRNKSDIPIEVDGGINDKTIKPAFDAGATRFVATSYVLNAENPYENFIKLNRLLGKNGS